MNTINNIVKIMNHYDVNVTVQTLIHNYQINHNKLAADLISRIFNDYKFSNQRVNFQQYTQLFPLHRHPHKLFASF